MSQSRVLSSVALYCLHWFYHWDELKEQPKT